MGVLKQNKDWAVLIALVCGTVVGAAAVTTVLLMIWQNAPLFSFKKISFDMGSFLGGALAAIAAFGLFWWQRLLDRRAQSRRQVLFVRTFCNRALAVIQELIAGGVFDDGPKGPKRIGFPGNADYCRNLGEVWNLKQASRNEELRVVLSEEVVPFVGGHLGRIGLIYDKLPALTEIPSDMISVIDEIARDIETLVSDTIALKLDTTVVAWKTATNDRQKSRAVAPLKLYERSLQFKVKVEHLFRLCGR
jgi:hypothetical protein